MEISSKGREERRSADNSGQGGGAIAGVRHTSPEFMVKAILGTKQRNKTTGAKLGLRRTHLSVESQARKAPKGRPRGVADNELLHMFGKQLSITERDKKMMESTGGSKPQPEARGVVCGGSSSTRSEDNDDGRLGETEPSGAAARSP